MIHQTTPAKLYWNYFLALEKDLETVARYVEFSQPNMGVYSIELAHLLFAASSEVDAIAKLLCQKLAPSSSRDNINDYRVALTANLTSLTSAKVFVPRYGLEFMPWDNWALTPVKNPDWWKSYNNVKHNRDMHFQEATLKNAINALGGLLLLAFYYYSYSLSGTPGQPLSPKDTTRVLEPESILLRLDDGFYYGHLLVS